MREGMAVMYPARIMFRFTGVVLSLWLLCGGTVTATDVSLVESRDLRTDGRTAESRKLPLMVVFSSDFCPYCELLEEDYLTPMLKSGDYTNRVVIRKFPIDRGRAARHFDGRVLKDWEIAALYEVGITPTVVLVDGNGEELVKRIIGVGNPHYFDYILDRTIDEARQNLAQRDARKR